MRLLCHANVYVDIVITGILTPETTKCQPLGKLAMLPNDNLIIKHLIFIYKHIINSFGAENPTTGHPTWTTKHKQSSDHSFYRSFSCISYVM